MKSFNRKLVIYGALVVSSLLTSTLFLNCAENSFEAAQTLGDPFFEYSWHLHNTGQRVFAASPATTGNDVNLVNTWNAGITGKGVRILISDDGIEDGHQDLKENYLSGNFSKDYSKPFPFLSHESPPKTNDDNHGTAVAGLIAAVANNGKGSKGIAYRASIASANFLSASSGMSEVSYVDQASGDYDIFNMSWGSEQNNVVPILTSFLAQLKAGTTSGRNGKGSIYVKAAGNNFYVACNGAPSSECVGNANFDGDNVYPYTIMVAALNAIGQAATYSSPGSNLWISSFGGESGSDDTPAMFTTDRTGCAAGRSQTTTTGTTVKFEKGQNGNDTCSYSTTFNGTSAAAPILSGAVALLLEANPNLSWRDVKYILAKTATPIFYPSSGTIPHPNTEPMPSGAVWDYKWVTNNAGFKFHNWYGFGQVNVDAAVTMAKSYVTTLGPFVETDFDNNMRSGLALAIPDNSAAGVADTMNVTNDMKIEGVQIRISATHAAAGQLGIELTSPAGTKSILVNMNNSLRGKTNFSEAIFLTNAFYQEDTSGVWTVKVFDGTTGTAGTLTKWSLRFSGASN